MRILFLLFLVTITLAVDCTAQTFTGDGDGTSWHDAQNWSTNDVPQSDTGAYVGAVFEDDTRYHVRINSTASVRGMTIEGIAQDDHYDPILTVSSPTFVSSRFNVFSSTVNFNADSTIKHFSQHPNDAGFLDIQDRSFVNFNSGTVFVDLLSIRDIEHSPQINQNGGNIDVNHLELQNNSLTFGANDYLRKSVYLSGSSLTLNSPQTLTRAELAGVGDIALGVSSIINVNADLTFTPAPQFGVTTFGLSGKSSLHLNDGTVTVESLYLENSTINRTGGQLMLRDLGVTRDSTMTLRANDIVTGEVQIVGDPNSGAIATLNIERPLAVEGLYVSILSELNYTQSSGGLTGISVEGSKFSGFNISDTGQMNLAFDNEPNKNGELDWVLRVYGEQDRQNIINAINDGQIVVSGGSQPVTVIYEPSLYGDYTYIGYVPTVTVTPESYQVTRGRYFSGGIAELSASDNMDLSARRSPTDVQSRVYIELESTSPTTTPDQLSLTVEASVFARTRVVQTIDLFNFDSGAFEEVDRRDAARFSDSTVDVSASGDLSRFVEPGSGAIKARVKFQSASNMRQSFSANIDQVTWKF